MGYSNGLVYFIDILGTKEKTFDELLTINRSFHRHLKLSQDIKNRSNNGTKHVMSFSDCAYILYFPPSNHNDPVKIMNYIYDNLADVALTILYLISHGYLCRGGISYGELYYEKENTIFFGPAVNKAYALETEAKMPRIIFDKELALKIMEYENKYKRNKRNIIIKDDEDSIYYINYLYIFKEYFSDKDAFLTLHNKLKNYSDRIIEVTENSSVKEKHYWHIKYLDRIKSVLSDLPKNKKHTLLSHAFVEYLTKIT